MTLATAFLLGCLALAAPEDEGSPLREQPVSGVGFRFESGSRDRHDLPEIMGGGVALIDADSDGLLDVFFCQGGPIGASNGEGADPPCRLYRNLGAWRFEDITERAGAPGPSYAMGAAVGDYDGDGRDDLFVTGWHGQRLYRNLGGCRFEDVTARAGLVTRLWSTSAAWADLDGDGDLDLMVANYLQYDPASAPYCAAPDGRRDYCGPEDFPSEPDRLYRNDGNGAFTEVSHSAGLRDRDGRGLGVLVADLVGDPRPDVFVANDGTACALYENLGGLRFREVGLASGVALDGQGSPLAAMGVAWGDLNEDGRGDLVVGNLRGRSTVAFLGREGGQFVDGSAGLGLALATRDVTGFGLSLEDFDADGHPDLLQANGHVLDRARLGVPLAMRPTFLRGGNKRLTVFAPAGWLARPTLARGLAVGDLDGDGRADAVMTALDAPPLFLRNVSQTAPLAIDLIGQRVQPFGARVRVTLNGRVQTRDLVGGGSYLSSSQRRLTFARGESTLVERVEVTWPSAKVESWSNLSAATPLRLVEGTGRR